MGKTLINPRQIKAFSEAEVLALFAETMFNLGLLKTNATKEELDYLSGVTSSIQEQLNAKLDSVKLKKDGEVVWTDDTTAATALAISRRIEQAVANAQIGGAMVFKGNWSARPTPTAQIPIKAGYTYVYDSGVAPTGVTVEAGDMLTAAVDITSGTQALNASSWVVVQTNIAGAVTTIETSLTSGRLLVGAGGKAIGVSNLTGLLKASAGVVDVAGAADIANVVGTAVSVGNATQQSQFNIKLGEMLSFAAGGGGAVIFDATKRMVTFTAPPRVTANANAVAGQYITGITVNASTGVITVTRATMPADVQQAYKSNVSVSGTKNGTNVTFTLPENVIATSVMLFLNGQCLVQGVDYNLSGTGNKTITFAADSNIPLSSDSLTASYVKA